MEKSKKRKIETDEKILAKAKKAIKFRDQDNSESSEHLPDRKSAFDKDEDDDESMLIPVVTDEEINSILNLEQPKKKRKPRHSEVPPKPKDPAEIARRQKAEGSSKKKKKHYKKKKKSKSSNSETIQALNVKNPESIDRHNKEALNYLQKWKHFKTEWKFEKLKQTWLLQNCLSIEHIPEEHFETFLEYVSTVKGHAKSETEAKMNSILQNFDSKDERNEADVQKYERAREILQMLCSDEDKEIFNMIDKVITKNQSE